MEKCPWWVGSPLVVFPLELLLRDRGYSGQEKVFQASHEFALLPRYTNRLNLSQKKGVPTWYTPGLQSFLKTYSEVTLENTKNYTDTSNVRTTKQSFNLLGWLVWPCICNRHIDIKITITFFVKRLWSQKLHNLMLKNDVFKMYPKYLCALVQLQLHHRYPILLSVRKTLNNYFYSVTSSLT